jgi:hypothetical protein
VKFVTDRPLADPEAAARKLLDIVWASIAGSGLPHAYTGVKNILSLRAGGTLDDYAAGRHFATAQKWFEIDRSGTRTVPLPDGAE